MSNACAGPVRTVPYAHRIQHTRVLRCSTEMEKVNESDVKSVSNWMWQINAEIDVNGRLPEMCLLRILRPYETMWPTAYGVSLHWRTINPFLTLIKLQMNLFHSFVSPSQWPGGHSMLTLNRNVGLVGEWLDIIYQMQLLLGTPMTSLSLH